MAPWIMNSEVTRKPWRLTFRIGSLEIAHVWFDSQKPVGSRVVLSHLGGDEYGLKTVSQAMSRMHELLNSPPQYINARDETDGANS